MKMHVRHATRVGLDVTFDFNGDFWTRAEVFVVQCVFGNECVIDDGKVVSG